MGSRPPGTTTWLRGARCTDPEEMPEKEARPPAQNRHGGAPRGERPSECKGTRHVSQDVDMTCAPVGAPPPLDRGGFKKPGRNSRRGNEKGCWNGWRHGQGNEHAKEEIGRRRLCTRRPRATPARGFP